MNDHALLAALLATGLVACAAPADRSRDDDDDDDDEGEASAAGGSSTGTETSAAGGVMSTSGGPPPPPPPACAYPAAPYGNHVGDTLPPSMAWQGFAEDSTTSGTVSIADYLDCDGSGGIHALLLIGTTEWCGVCKQEAQTLEALTSGPWEAQGIHVATLVMQDASAKPASVATAQKWKQTFGLWTSAVVADPGFSLAIADTTGTPLEVVVDPRTMKIVHRQEGYSGQHPQLEQLAAGNAP